MLRILGAHTRTTRITTVAASLVTAAGLAVAFTPPTANAAAPQVTGYTISGMKTKVHTSKGHKVVVSISAGYSTAQGGARLSAPDTRLKAPKMAAGSTSAYVTVGDSKQSHGWFFRLPKKAVSLSASGKGKIVPRHSKTAPYAKIALTAKPKGSAKTQRCQGQVISKTQVVKLSGTFWLDTRSGKHGWGTVGSKSKSFTFSTRATVTWSYANTTSGCYHFVDNCSASKSWYTYSSHGTLNGDTRTVSGTRYKKLSKPKGAFRNDYVSGAVKSAKLAQNGAAGTAKFTIKGNGSASTGSATINGTDRYSYSYPCGASKTVKNTGWTATLKNGAKPLKVHDIYGAIGTKTGTEGSISVTTVATS